MIISNQLNSFPVSRSSKNTVSIFQPMNKLQANGVRKMGFICEAENTREGVDGIVHMVADYCSSTRTHPADILDKPREAA